MTPITVGMVMEKLAGLPFGQIAKRVQHGAQLRLPAESESPTLAPEDTERAGALDRIEGEKTYSPVKPSSHLPAWPEMVRRQQEQAKQRREVQEQKRRAMESTGHQRVWNPNN